MDDFSPDPDAVEYRIQNSIWASDGPQERGVRSMELHGIDKHGTTIHTHTVRFDGNPYYPELPSLHAIVLRLNETISNR